VAKRVKGTKPKLGPSDLPIAAVAPISYVASKVIKRQSKGKTILQFCLTITFNDGAAVEVRNCILGVGKKGPWCTAPLIKYRPIILNKILCDKLIENFQKQGFLDDLVPTTFAEDQEVELTWTN